jgi:hypothetical protein
MTRRHTPESCLRGIAAGLLTAALAFAAHGLAGGGLPSASGAALLAVLSATVGGVVVVTARARGTRVLVALLGAGQLVGHLVLAVAGHGHHSSGMPLVPMLLAHIIAVAVGALLIAASGRLCAAVCTALRRFSRGPRQLASAAATPAVRGDQPMRALLLLAASISHRGPPVSQALLT